MTMLFDILVKSSFFYSSCNDDCDDSDGETHVNF